MGTPGASKDQEREDGIVTESALTFCPLSVIPPGSTPLVVGNVRNGDPTSLLFAVELKLIPSSIFLPNFAIRSLSQNRLVEVWENVK